MRTLQARLTRRNEESSILKYQLITWTDPIHYAVRVRCFQDLQSVVDNNRASTIHATGLRSLFYARYYCLYGIATSKIVDFEPPAEHLVLKPPSVKVKELADVEILDALGVRVPDAFQRVLQLHVDHHEEWMAYEAKIFDELPLNPHLRDVFVALNMMTLPYIKSALKADLKCLNHTLWPTLGLFSSAR